MQVMRNEGESRTNVAPRSEEPYPIAPSEPLYGYHFRRHGSPRFRPRPIVTASILDLIGNTPLLQLRGERIFAKAEFLNPGGSIKDRVALAMLLAAQREGKLDDHSVICEPTSGNTGIGLALVGKMMGYRVRIVMPEGMSEERKKLIRALGADLVLIPDAEGLRGGGPSGPGDGRRRPPCLRAPAV